MTPKPPDGFDLVASLTLVMREADEAFEQVGGGTRHHVRECLLPAMEKHGISVLPATELAALRARVAAAEDRCDEHVAHVVEIGDVLDAEDGETALEAAKRTMRKLEAATNLIAHTAARVAELERWKESAMLVLGENHVALQQHGQLGEGAADCMNRLAKQVAALANGLEMLRNEDNCWCDGPEKDRRGETDMTTHYGYCSEIRAALRAAGRKT